MPGLFSGSGGSGGGGGGTNWGDFDVPNPFEGGGGGNTHTTGGGGGGGNGGFDPVMWAKMNLFPVMAGAGDEWGGKSTDWLKKITGNRAAGAGKKIQDFLNPQGKMNNTVPEINKVDFANQLQTMINNGPGAGGQDTLANALREQSLTGGPQAQIAQNNLRQSTNQNIAQNAGFLSSQKGINPALAARMSAQNAGTMNQSAAGQAENLKLASMLGAQNQLGDVLNQRRQGDNAYLQALSGGNAAQNQAINTGSLGAQDLNNQIALQNLKGRQGMFGGLMNSLGSMMTGSGGGGGGLSSLFGKTPGTFGASPPVEKSDDYQSGSGDSGYEGGGGGGVSPTMNLYYAGGKLPGKADVPGDSPENDDLVIKASPGEIIVPRTAAKDPEAAKKFIDELFKKNKKTGFKDVLSARRAKDEAGSKAQRYYDGGLTVGEDQSMAAAEEPTAPGMTWRDEAKATLAKQNAAADASVAKKKEDEKMEGVTLYNEQFERGKKFGMTDEEIKAEIGEQPVVPSAVDEASRQNPNLAPVESEPVATAPAKQEDPFGSGYGKVVNGIMGEAKAAQAYSQKAEQAYNDLNAQLATAKQSFDKNYAALDAENRQIMADIRTQKIDPNRYWSNTSTAQKVASGIGLMLSGIGSGLTGQPNLAAKMIDDGIARDIDAQKAELGKKETLLSANLKRYGNLKDAYAATTAQMTAVTQGQIAGAAAKMGGEQAMARANEMIGKLEMQRQSQLGSLAKAQMKGQQMSVAAAEAAFPGQYVKLPNGNAMVAQSKEEATKLRSALQTQKEFHALLNDAERFMKDEAGTLGTMPGSARNDLAKQYVTKMTFAIKNLEKLGVLSENDTELADAMSFDPGSFWSSSNQLKLKGLRSHVDQRTDAALSTGLIGNYSPTKAAAGDIQ